MNGLDKDMELPSPDPDTENQLRADALSMEGVWTSEGAFTIEWQDEDHVKVTKHWRGFDDVAILTGGDFETILETLFTQAKVTRTHHDSSANAKDDSPPPTGCNPEANARGVGPEGDSLS